MTPPVDDSVTTGTTEVVFAATVVDGAIVVAGATVLVGDELGIGVAPTWEIPITEVARTSPTEVKILFILCLSKNCAANEVDTFMFNVKILAVVVMPRVLVSETPHFE